MSRGTPAALAVAVIVVLSGAAAAPPCADEAQCRSLCERTEPVGAACAELGRIHARGLGGAPDQRLASAAYERACEAGDADGCLAVGELRRDGWGLDVPRDPDAARGALERAIVLAQPGCDGGGARECRVVAAARLALLRGDDWQDPDGNRSRAILATATTACEKGNPEACVLILRDLWRMDDIVGDDQRVKAGKLARGQLIQQCARGTMPACTVLVSFGDFDAAAFDAVADDIARQCTDRADASPACLAKAFLVYEGLAGKKGAAEAEREKAAFQLLVETCTRSIDPLCAYGAALLFDDRSEVGVAIGADPKTAIAILEHGCAGGVQDACLEAGKRYAAGDGVGKDAAAARRTLDRACRLEAPQVRTCAACTIDPTLPECTRRDTWQIAARCSAGDLGACETLGERYETGHGIDRDAERAAESYQKACVAGGDGSCKRMRRVCDREARLAGSPYCDRPLIGSDVFNEAEWQFRETHVATILKGEAGATVTLPSVSTVGGDGHGGGGLRYERGSLDADLVVSVVLDRARQAAIRLVVEELEAKAGRRGLRTYVKDVLAQAARLLGDSTSLRRDVLHDLGKTLVRALVASNLERTRFATAADVERHLGIALDGKAFADPALHAYLADAAYWALGTQPLLARSGRDSTAAPACPFRAGAPRRAICDALDTPDEALEAMGVDHVMAAIGIAQSLQKEGVIDVRRLIEAATDARTIASFSSTPGLSLDGWRTDLVDLLEPPLDQLRAQLGALRTLLDPATWSASGPPLESLFEIGAQVRGLLRSQAFGVVLPKRARSGLEAIAAILTRPEGAAALQVDVDDVRRRAKAALEALGATVVGEIHDKRKKLLGTLTEAGDHLDALRRQILVLRTMFARDVDGVAADQAFAIGRLKLRDLAELEPALENVVRALDGLDRTSRALLPDTDLRGLRTIYSSVIRVLGFIDLMARLSRSMSFDLSCQEILDTLKLLGGKVARGDAREFAAPLYDTLEPVLHAVKAHEPMSLEHVFAVVAKVRLDSLVTTLVDQSPCKGGREDSAECWVFKVAYSLQEAIEQDGATVRIHGANVAQSLATFGDDFRKRHTWHAFFHLTVGAGGLVAPSMAAGSDEQRFSPLVTEQVGFGWASPAFWKDRLTLKLGLAASGILYRMVVDSEESDAIMATPFVALDVYDLVELNAGPTVLFYPPSDASDSSIDLGFTFQASVPLTAYLERL